MKLKPPAEEHKILAHWTMGYYRTRGLLGSPRHGKYHHSHGDPGPHGIDLFLFVAQSAFMSLEGGGKILTDCIRET